MTDDTKRAVRRALTDIFPVIAAAAPIGLLFGAIAAGKGLSPLEAWLMSALVFAGGAQFTAIELWAYPVPVGAVIFSTLLVNSRHVLMGASLAPKLTAFPPRAKVPALFFMADENWALAERKAARDTVSLAYWLAMSLAMWLTWTTSTGIGAVLGAAIEDPARYGFDFVFTAMFIGLVMGFWTSRHAGAGIVAAAAVSALTYELAGPPWHVAAGATAGLAAAFMTARPQEARA
ncbi:MAG: AzlC family ABC transporter permease [Flavobacteriaceae bacterium]